MKAPSIENNDEVFEDAVCKLSLMGTTRDEAKAATEKFLLTAISKANAHYSLSRRPMAYLDDVFRDLSELSGLCAWHSRKLSRIISLVRADDCNIGMIQALEKPLAGFFSRDFGDDFLVSVKDYAFYAGIKLEKRSEDGGIDIDILRWAKRSTGRYDDIGLGSPAMRSGPGGSIAVEILRAVEAHLEKWKIYIRSRSSKERKLQRIKRKIAHFIGSSNSDGDQDKMSLGASPEEFESLINSMQTHIEKVGRELASFGNVTSSRHGRALIVLRDDIRLQVKCANGLGLAIVRWPDSTPYQRAQALEVRVKD